MKYMLRHSDKVVGVFVVAGSLFLVIALLFVGINKRWFKSDLSYISHFHTAEGLSPGLALELRGFAIGSIKSLALNEANQVEVNFSIFNEYADRIVPGSVIELAVKPLGFGSSLIFYPGGGGGVPLIEGAIIPSSDSALGRKLLAEGKAYRPKRQDEMSTLIENLYPLVAQVESIMSTTDRMLTRLDQRLLGDENGTGTGLLGTVDGTLLTADQTIREFGDMAAQLDSTVLRLEKVFQSLATFAVHLEDPTGLVPTLLGDEGSAAQFFQDQGKLYQSLSDTAEELRQLMVFMNGSTPEIALLMEEATAALIESEKVMQGLKNNPLLRGGIASEEEGPGTFQGYRQDGR
jgi:phospholipid/cholesterol/gamma-HCH transport system substrate-binding protein